MHLDLLGRPQVRVRQVREPIAAAGPGLDGELEAAVLAPHAELDLPGLQVAAERGQAQRVRARGHHAHRSVPRPGMRTMYSSPTAAGPSPSSF